MFTEFVSLAAILLDERFAEECMDYCKDHFKGFDYRVWSIVPQEYKIESTNIILFLESKVHFSERKEVLIDAQQFIEHFSFVLFAEAMTA